jgi:hypothetical protein
MTKTHAELTPRQIELARHALGLTRSKTSYRNHFCAHAGSDDHKHWDDMVEKGFANVKRNFSLSGNGDAFWLNIKGAKAVLRRGEKLSKEDFPNVE